MVNQHPQVGGALRFVHCLNEHNLDGLAALMTPDHVLIGPDGWRVAGREASAARWRDYWSAFPDYRVHPSQAIVAGNAVLLFGRKYGAQLFREVEALSPIIWTAQVRHGLVCAWSSREDNRQARRELKVRRGQSIWLDSHALSQEMVADLQALPLKNTPNRDRVRAPYYQRLKTAPAEQVVELAFVLLEECDERSTAHGVLEHHPGALATLREADLGRLGEGINSWWSVDGFATYVAGVAWRQGQIDDEVVHRWARSPDRWWRRAALVCTVALNRRARGGHGDVPRTLAVCRLLVDDHNDMVVKALSWALRELVFWDRQAVEGLLAQYRDRLAARVRREVRHKLDTGLKNPRRGGRA